MKTSVLLLFLTLCATAAAAQNVTRKKAPIPYDTIQPGEMVCIDGNVVQFTVTVVQNGVITKTTTVEGNCYPESYASRPGNTIYCENIVLSPQPGMYVRIPPKKFYVYQKLN